MFNSEQRRIITQTATDIGVDVNKLLAFMLTETNGVAFAVVDGRDEPLIRWEGHYFFKLIQENLRAKAISLGLANQKVGGVKNPKDQAGRYALLARGKKLDVIAAISSCSWGIGQVMGAHWKWLGYSSAVAFEKEVRSGFVGQITAMALFLDRSGIIPHLKRGDWSAVARIYNGKDYAKNKYDVKMKANYESLVGTTVANEPPKSAGMLRVGSKGPGVRELQNLLVRAGFSVKPDGDFGTSTEKALKTYQTTNGLEADGVAGKLTMASLQKLKVNPDENLGIQPLLENKTVKNGLISGIGGAATIQAAKGSIDEAVQQVAGLAGSPFIDYVTGGLTVLSATLAIGGLAYAAYGWYKKDRSFNGTEDLA